MGDAVANDGLQGHSAKHVAADAADPAHLEKRVISLGHTETVRSVAFSPDGKRALTSSDDGSVRIWDVESETCIRVLNGHSDFVYTMAWNGDARLALSGSEDNTVRTWDVDTGECIHVLKGHSGAVWSVALNADAQLALSGSKDNTVRIWNVKSGECRRVLEGHSGPVWSVALSADDRFALSGSDDNTLRIWEIKSGKCRRVLKGHSSAVYCVAWSADAQLALSGSDDNTLRIWNVSTKKCVQVFEGHSGAVLSVAWNSDSRRAISGSRDNTVRIWDIESRTCMHILEGHSSGVYSVAWQGNDQFVLSASRDNTVRFWDVESGKCRRVLEGRSSAVWSMAWNADARRALLGSDDNTVRIWDIESRKCIRVLEGHSRAVWSVAWSADDRFALSGSHDNTLRVWNVKSEECIKVLKGHSGAVWSVAWIAEAQHALSGSDDHTVRIWDVESGKCIHVLEGHSGAVYSVAVSADARFAISGSDDNTVRIWDVKSGKCEHVLEGHSGAVYSVAWNADARRAISGSRDNTVRIWDVESGKCIRVLEGHSKTVLSLAWNANAPLALSGSDDNTVRIWDVESGKCVRVLEGHSGKIRSVQWSDDSACSGAADGVTRIWDTRDLVSATRAGGAGVSPDVTVPEQVQYTNAKVLLVGDSGVGKTGLANYLALSIRDNERNTATDGAWATHWPLPNVTQEDDVQREIWLWDFAGQVDYRLVHQLFMDETAVAVLVFNPQTENPFEGLGQWDHDLRKAMRKPFAKLLAAGRVDRGGSIVSRASMDRFLEERAFHRTLHETSAKTGQGCEELRESIVQAIGWQHIPKTTSPALYHRMKQEILRLRDSGLVLIRLPELKQRMELALPGDRFTSAELETVVGLLAGPGIVQRLDFGGFVLLRPEVLSRYAAALVRTVRKHPQELGCIREDEMLAGDLDYQDFTRLRAEDEAVVLRTLLETFVSRAWCFRQAHGNIALLTFPSYFRREREVQPGHPSVLVTYRFTGPVDEIYATLVVRLHHTEAFESAALWRFAADFKTQTGQTLGLMLTREAEGAARVDVYFNPDVELDSRLVFLRYVHNHLTEQAQNVVRLRHYACGNERCLRPFTDRDLIDEVFAAGGSGKVFCPKCQFPILIRDVLEDKFESREVRLEAIKLGQGARNALQKESLELILVGHAFAITAEADQIYRGYTNSDHGIDGEIEFRDHKGHATGKRLYLQLKSGDSYLKKRQRDGAQVFRIKKPRWAELWQNQAYPVMLVIRSSDGNIRWMEVSSYLKREFRNTGKRVTQIEFEGERFDMTSVRRWRDKALSQVSQ